MAERPRQTLTDYVVLALSPALIMALVGSLVFFLVEILYAGGYGPEMRWMLFFFVFGMVLIARIALMGEIAARAGAYALILGVLVWFGLLKYVDYPKDNPVAHAAPLVNAIVVFVAWWCVMRLVRDCTHIDDRTQIDSRGLLQAAGLEELDIRAEERRKHGEKVEPARQSTWSPEEKPDDEPRGWWARWSRYREEKARRRTPGVTVVWFSLAALPIFGLGQALIPVEAAGRRQYVFWLMTVYLGSGLGLLMTTSFLGLRRYLNQRKLKMPARMTSVWLGVGFALIAVLLLLGSFLPRPLAEYPLIDMTASGSDKPGASRFAPKDGSAGEGEGRTGAGKDSKEDPNAREGKDSGKTSKSKDGSGKEKDREKGGGKDKDRGPDKGKDKDKGSEEGSGRQSGDSTDEPSSSSSLSGLSEMLKSASDWLKWIVFGLIALVVVFLLLRSGLKWLAQFFDWARNLLDALRNFWASLFGGGAGQETTTDESSVEKAPPRPFAEYRNPFPGTNLPLRELVRYTFAAFEAWAQERHHLDRADGETPAEFAERVGGEVPAVEDASRRLADLFARAEYSADRLPAGDVAILRDVWNTMDAAGAPVAMAE
jgi:hypothetical protein